jgi:4-alpha-glucanotransferase
VLLHVSSLPGSYGIGDLGPAAMRWVHDLARAKQSWWQMLPLNPPDGHSPYNCFSAFAGNPDLISLELLARDGLISESDLNGADFPEGVVDFRGARAFKTPRLRRAWQSLRSGSLTALADEYRHFCAANSAWLEDFALFMALRELHHGKPWTDWPAELRSRSAAAMHAARRELHSEIDFHAFVQYLFFRQLDALRKYAREKSVRIIGDVPLFVSANSADVWAHAEQFLLDRHGRPKFVSGVPPDYFSKTGQRWGNPLYNWPAMRRDGFRWWIKRIDAALRQADLVRIDHFRGFEACWAIPASQPTAKHGRWAKAPGRELLTALRRHLRRAPFIAEDLGLITPAVAELRDDFHIPGMRVLQFGFGGDGKDPFLPHNYPQNCVAYTGTHDNDTTVGWFATLDRKHRERLATYTGADASDVARDLTRLAWSSVAGDVHAGL